MREWSAYEQSDLGRIEIGIIDAPDAETALTTAKQRRTWNGSAIGIVRAAVYKPPETDERKAFLEPQGVEAQRRRRSAWNTADFRNAQGKKRQAAK